MASVYDPSLMSTKFCKVKVEHSKACQPNSVADAIEAFLQEVRESTTLYSFSLVYYFSDTTLQKGRCRNQGK